MKKHNSVPKLNLAPKLKRPLSLWNPLDYLRLLYWVFFFPQAIQYYIDKFKNRGNFIKSEGKNNRFSKTSINSIVRKIFIQGFVLIFFLLLIPTYQLIELQFFDGYRAVSIDRTNQKNKEQYKHHNFNIDEYNKIEFGEHIANLESLGLYNNPKQQSSFSAKLENAYSLDPNSMQWWLIGIVYTSWIAVHLGVLKPWKNISSGLIFIILVGIELSIFLWIGYLVSFNETKANYFLHAAYLLKAVFETANRTYMFLSMGIVMGVIISINRSLQEKVNLDPIATSIVFLLAIIHDFYTDNLLFSVAYLLPCYFLCFRLESWLISCLFNNQKIFNPNRAISRVTSIPLPYISSRLKSWLEQDWETGIYNANQLVKYTLQFVPVSKTVNRVLAATSDTSLIYRFSQLAADPCDWKLIHFASAPINTRIQPLSHRTRINTPARATAAGFWYLHEKQPDKATEAFNKVRSLLYGEEVYTLAKTLAVFYPAKELKQIANLSIPIFPQQDLLRPVTWKILTNLQQVVEDVKTIQNSVSRTTKALALNRAIGELTTILNASQIIPEAERESIVEIAQNWKYSLETIAKDLGDISITKPVINPYVIGDPVQGSLFAGREDIMRQLEELWSSDRLQSVVLYGHRRMGKTSILLNINNGNQRRIQIAYINLLRLGDCSQGVGEVLMQICDGIAEVTSVAPPDDDALLKLPYRTFERYIKQIGQTNKGLIIAIDEFEKIEELIELQRIPTDFLGFLRGIVQMNSKIALIFAGLHTLEEMTADYFQPFFASVIPLHVGFLNAASTLQILANPVDLTSPESNEFILDYTPEALNLIYNLTAGQPYLVQLIGFQLVRSYNQEMFELETVRDPIFSIEDVEKIIDRQFFQKGRYYFEGVWGQAGFDVKGQQEIIKTLALYPQGLSESDLIDQVNLASDVCFTTAISRLKRHDVIIKTDTGWRIVVELFRLWVVDTQ